MQIGCGLMYKNQGGDMTKALASLLIVAVLATGCTGPFNLTKKVYNFHRSQTDKWADELCFLLVVLTPVYGLATLGDAIIFNSIEFWTGNNPISVASDKKAAPRLVENGKHKALMAYDTKTDQVKLTTLSTQQQNNLVFERNDKMVTAKNEKGEVLYTSVQGNNGDITVYDSKGNLIKNYPAGQIAMLKEKYLEKEQF
jgi:hypothetical protein